METLNTFIRKRKLKIIAILLISVALIWVIGFIIKFVVAILIIAYIWHILSKGVSK